MKTRARFLTAAGAIREIQAGRLSAAEYAALCSRRVADLDSRVRAWVRFDAAKAIAQAAAVDDKRGKALPVGPLHGLPVGVKDIFHAADMETGMGSPIWRGFRPGHDARVVHMLRRADATLPGKTVTAEFAVHTPGETLNPHDPEFSPGTSSSGSAAAVSAAMVPLALGTQTAGSIVRPASYCGVYGFKPSFGLIPRTGMLKTTDSLDQVGFFARSIEDLELLFDVARVRGSDYPMSDSGLKKPGPAIGPDRPWRVGVVTSSLWVWKHAFDYAKDALARFSSAIAGSGARVEEARLPSSFNDAHSIHEVLYDRTLAYYFREEFERRELMSEVLKRMILHGQTITLEDYRIALGRQAALSRELDALFDRYDVLLALSTAGQAPRRADPDVPDSCLIWTLCGVPVISVPAFFSPRELPFGAQVLTRRYGDRILLDFLKHLERHDLAQESPIPERLLGDEAPA